MVFAVDQIWNQVEAYRGCKFDQKGKYELRWLGGWWSWGEEVNVRVMDQY